MLVDEERDVTSALAGQVPSGSKLYKMRNGQPILLKNRLIYSGDNIVDSAPGFDSQSARPIVSITLDARGAAINQRVTGENVGKRMAVVYIEIKSEPRLDEQGRPMLDEQGRALRVSRRVEEVITAPVIRQQLGKRFQIEGLDSVNEANELSLLLRAGAFAAPVEIVEERTVGPSLGADNIQRGFHSTWIGFAAIAVFVIVYYLIFGVTSVLALGSTWCCCWRCCPCCRPRSRCPAWPPSRSPSAWRLTPTSHQRAYPRRAAQRQHAPGQHPRRL